jgi:hypothetical protein
MPAVVLKSLSCSQHSELLLLLRHHLFPLLFKTLSERSAFPLALRATRVVFLLLKQFSSKLETEAEVILTLLIKLISGETDTGEPRPGWMRVLAMEIMRGWALYTSFLAHWLTGDHDLLYVLIRAGFVVMPSSCAASGSVTMP